MSTVKSQKDKAPANPVINRAAVAQLATFIQRADRILDEVADRQEDLKDLWKEAASVGFDAKAIETLVKKRRKDPDNEKIKQSLEDVYLNALKLDMGELGRWARERDLAESGLRTQATIATMQATSDTVVDAFAVAHGLDEGGEAAARLTGGVRTTVSINGGPEVDIETVKKAVKRVRPGKGSNVIDTMQQAVSEELAEGVQS